jgi:hypothetical protein
MNAERLNKERILWWLKGEYFHALALRDWDAVEILDLVTVMLSRDIYPDVAAEEWGERCRVQHTV